MADFAIEDKNYRTARKLSAFEQFHCARKLAPLLNKFGATVPSMNAALPDLLAPIVDALAAMSEEDCNYILYRCLAVVQRQQGQTWATIWNTTANRLMFDDIDMGTMIQVAMQVLSENLGNFINAPSSTSATATSTDSDIPANLSAFPMVKTG